ncbi:MAG: hypothetical protein O7E57_05455 [Gammaproteobacteria bacterium]|nr:hypothetical protein [Gammaproteobacteria bacterium]
MRVSSPGSGVIGGLLLSATMVCTPCSASEDGAGIPGDFLEYLGTLVDHDGEWVDALELADGAMPDGDGQQTSEPESDDLASSSNMSSTTDDEAEE